MPTLTLTVPLTLALSLIPHQEYDAPVLENEELYKRKVRGRGRGAGRVTGSPNLTP